SRRRPRKIPTSFSYEKRENGNENRHDSLQPLISLFSSCRRYYTAINGEVNGIAYVLHLFEEQSAVSYVAETKSDGGEKLETFKILLTSSFYPPYHVGGACIHVKNLADELAKRGHEVHVIHSIDAYRLKRGKLPHPGQTAQENVHVYPIESHFKILDPIAAYNTGISPHIQNQFEKLVKNISPDIVHHHNTNLLGYSLFQKVSKYLCLFTAHDYWLICPTDHLLRNQREVCHKKTCFSCSIIH